MQCGQRSIFRVNGASSCFYLLLTFSFPCYQIACCSCCSESTSTNWNPSSYPSLFVELKTNHFWLLTRRCLVEYLRRTTRGYLKQRNIRLNWNIYHVFELYNSSMLTVGDTIFICKFKRWILLSLIYLPHRTIVQTDRERFRTNWWWYGCNLWFLCRNVHEVMQ